VVPDWLAGLHGLVPPWLAEVVRPKPAPLPWPDMIRAALAICVARAIVARPAWAHADALP
jgi:hypothetical protein